MELPFCFLSSFIFEDQRAFHSMFLLLTRLPAFVLLFNALFTTAVLSDTASHQECDNHGAVASESSVCSKIGINLLKHGGNAADALVGTVLCVGVIGMYHSG